MYAEDPALLIKLNGRPVAEMPNDVSLDVGNNPQEEFKGKPQGKIDPITSNQHTLIFIHNLLYTHHVSLLSGWSYGRKAVLTGDPLTRAGAQRAGIFTDDFPPK
jgi:hypothetical protein